MKRKLLSLILALLMVVSIAPLAFAVEDAPARPTATVTEISVEDPELTFALNFFADEPTEEQLAYYGSWKADYELTVENGATFDANGGYDGYLAGQYDDWSENWISVPFEPVTLEPGVPFRIMAYAAEELNEPGLYITYNDVVTSVRDFDCGVFFTEEYIENNPGSKITLQLKMYNPEDASENYVIGTYVFYLPGKTVLTEDMVSLDADSCVYNGSAQEPAVTVMDGETALVEGVDYTVEYTNNVNAGTATITITGTENPDAETKYVGTVTKTFAIEPATLTVKAKTQVVKVGSAPLDLNADQNYTVTGLAEGDTVAVTLTTDANYNRVDVYTIAVQVDEVTPSIDNYNVVTKNGNLVVMPEKTEEDKEEDNEDDWPFIDVDEDDWFYGDVKYVYENGLMIGISDNLFDPYGDISRAMVVTTLWRMEGSPEALTEADFTDVPDGKWYSEAIDWAAENGIVNGMGDGTFAPLQAVTREQAAAMLNRYASFKGWTVEAVDADEYTHSNWSAENIDWADTVGLFDGLGVDVTNQTKTASRAELAAFLTRFCLNVIK